MQGQVRRVPWMMLEPLHHVHVLLGMVEELVVATVTYPLVVLDRRMCVDVSACPSDEANARETLLTALAVCACVVAACCDGVPSAMQAGCTVRDALTC